jgi:hypothetical protein
VKSRVPVKEMLQVRAKIMWAYLFIFTDYNSIEEKNLWSKNISENTINYINYTYLNFYVIIIIIIIVISNNITIIQRMALDLWYNRYSPTPSLMPRVMPMLLIFLI